jgi:hypothetical protein
VSRVLNYFIDSIRTHSNIILSILEELVDKQKRARLWDIYLGTKNHTKDKLTRAETVRIRHIEKQLATLNRNRRLTNETLFPPEEEPRYVLSRSDSRHISRQLSTVEIPTILRRRSSFDQQTLERWKALANQSTTHEQMPWTIRKLMIRKYFRRPTKPLSIIHQDSIIDNSSPLTNHNTHLIRHGSETIVDSIPASPERQNPYLSYFFQPSNHPSILTSKFFSVSSNHLNE